MIVAFAFGFLLSFLDVAVGSYVGAKLALQSFFGGNFTDAGRFALPATAIDEPADVDEQ
ncbi:hypothetical protein QA600_08750 [Natronococcus sp. A-GB1]|uniref:hypothetical protein n=1 Tax=Natronococcus sp. A-GB1 TaxID=3037648 RepID=UPI00241F543F|nr:hypothetical protein [Natronococcus sp. A-GB1]MDG5759429.1 hypothetical protein [Natronococcus sp. A-GB1]